MPTRRQLANLERVFADRKGDPLQVLESTFAAGPWTTDHEFCDAFERIVAAEPSLRAHRQYLEWDFERVVNPYIAKRFGLDEQRAALVTGALFGAIRAARERAATQTAADDGRLMRDAFSLVEPLVQVVRGQSRRRIGAR